MSEEWIAEIIRERHATYLAKHHAADPFGEEVYSKWEALKYVLEAVEIIARELGVKLEDTVSDD